MQRVLSRAFLVAVAALVLLGPLVSTGYASPGVTAHPQSIPPTPGGGSHSGDPLIIKASSRVRSAMATRCKQMESWTRDMIGDEFDGQRCNDDWQGGCAYISSSKYVDCYGWFTLTLMPSRETRVYLQHSTWKLVNGNPRRISQDIADIWDQSASVDAVSFPPRDLSCKDNACKRAQSKAASVAKARCQSNGVITLYSVTMRSCHSWGAKCFHAEVDYKTVHCLAYYHAQWTPDSLQYQLNQALWWHGGRVIYYTLGKLRNTEQKPTFPWSEANDPNGPLEAGPRK